MTPPTRGKGMVAVSGTDLAQAKDQVRDVWRRVTDLQAHIERARDYESRKDTEQWDNLNAALDDVRKAADALGGVDYNLGNC